MARRRRRSNQPTPAPSTKSYSRTIPLTPTRFGLFADSQIQKLHEASLTILSQTGIRFLSPKAIAYFAQSEARIEDNRVYLSPALVEQALQQAPSQYTLNARIPENTVTLGNDTCVVMPGGGPPYVLDLENTRRPGTLADMENFTKLTAISPEIHVVARKSVEAQDVPVPIRHLACWYAALTLADKPIQSGFVGGQAEAEDALAMLAVVFGGEDKLNDYPVAQCSVNVNSPLQYDTPMLESLITFAQFGQPVLISPFVMAGVTGPTTLAGTLAQQNAEVLAGVVLTQLIRPGTPVLYGSASSNIDMRNGNPAIGSPESAINIAVCAQLARYYGLPCRGGGALTDSLIPDAQSNYERMFTLMTSILSGVNYMMQGVGILESYLTISYEQFVIDLDLLAMVGALAEPIEISSETLALDTIDAVGPGGHFLEADHTIRHYRDAHFIPKIGLRQPYEQWEAEGSRDARQRANERCREMLEAYQQPAMDTDVADKLYNFVERRKAQLLS